MIYKYMNRGLVVIFGVVFFLMGVVPAYAQGVDSQEVGPTKTDYRKAGGDPFAVRTYLGNKKFGNTAFASPDWTGTDQDFLRHEIFIDRREPDSRTGEGNLLGDGIGKCADFGNAVEVPIAEPLTRNQQEIGRHPISGRTSDRLHPADGDYEKTLYSPSEYATRHQVLYYHLRDSDATANKNPESDKQGKIEGRACSPLYGLVLFSQDDQAGGYPPGRDASNEIITDPDNTCLGLAAEARQVQVIKKTDNTIVLRGCAYAPYFSEFLLFGKDGYDLNGDGVIGGGGETVDTGSFSDSDRAIYDDWDGVRAVTNVIGFKNTLELKGCAWSKEDGLESGHWAFSSGGQEECFNEVADQQVYIRNTLLNGGDANAFVAPDEPGVKELKPTSGDIAFRGQKITIKVSCVAGLAPGDIVITYKSGDKESEKSIQSELVDASAVSDREFSYEEVFVRDHKRYDGDCVDIREFFYPLSLDIEGPLSIDVGVRLKDFQASPAVLTEGGLVGFPNTSISNNTQSTARCRILSGEGEPLIYKIDGSSITQLDDGAGWFDEEVGTSDFGGIPIIDVATKDTQYAWQCEYTDRYDGIKKTTGGLGATTNRAVVRVLPNRLIERKIDENSCRPEVDESSDDPTEVVIKAIAPTNDENVIFDCPTVSKADIEELHIYALEPGRAAGKESIGESSRYCTYTENEENESDPADTCDATPDPAVTKTKFPADSKVASIEKSDVAGKVLVMEYYFKGGFRSAKTLYFVEE